MGVLKTLIETSTKKSIIKTVGNTVGNVAVSAIDAVSNYKENRVEKKFVCVPFSSDSYSLRNYQEVFEELTAYGFNNIALLPKRDLIKGWLIKDGQIEKIVISGKEKFKKNSKFEPDVRVVITYHTFK